MTQDMNKVAVVSGGSKGLGFSICERLADEGYRVATFSRKSSEAIEALIARSEGRVHWQSVDIADPAQLADFMRNVRERFGRVGYLVNCAGIANEGLLTMMKPREISRMLDVNVTGAIALTQACSKQMMVGGFGSIVNVSSVVGVRGFKGVAAYSATKAALDGFTRSLSKELGSVGVRVNAVGPGPTFANPHDGEALLAAEAGGTPLGRKVEAHDIAEAVCFLASDRAGFISGQKLDVDGGYGA